MRWYEMWGECYKFHSPAINRICKFIPNNPAKPTTLKQALDTEPSLQEEYNTDPTIKHMMDLAMQLEGLFRHASTHRGRGGNRRQTP